MKNVDFYFTTFKTTFFVVWLIYEKSISLILTEIIVRSYHYHKLQQAVCKIQTHIYGLDLNSDNH